MKHSHLKVAALAATVALAAPVTAGAAKPDWAGQKGGPNSEQRAELKGKGKDKAKGKDNANNRGKGQGRGKGKGGDRVKTAKANFRGTVLSVEGTVVTVAVEKANAHGKGCRGQELSFDAAGARVKTADHNADGVSDVSDVQAGHYVGIHAAVTRVKGKKRECPVAAGTPVAAQKLVNRTDPAGEDEDETEDDEDENENENEETDPVEPDPAE